MNQTQALNKLRKVLGAKFGYRIDPKAPSADEREAASAKYHAIVPQVAAAKEAVEARRNELLRDPAYQEMLKSYQALRDARDSLQSGIHNRRITVGISTTMFFHVRADGDNWDEVVEKVCAERAAA